MLLLPQAFAQHGAEEAVGDDDIVTQLRMRRNLLGDLIAAKDVQVRSTAADIYCQAHCQDCQDICTVLAFRQRCMQADSGSSL